VLGGLFGLFGHAFAIAGLQRWFSIAAGAVVLIAVALSFKSHTAGFFPRGIMLIKSKFSSLLGKRTLISIAGLGALNGLLPCGLVYVACAAAAATGTALTGATYMVVFGLGTTPTLMALALGGGSLRLNPFKVKRLVPIAAVIAGLLLIVRGLGLGIPYASPAPAGHCPACVAKAL
jgi:sulfite exporter TauE/SafE